jgi:hypothetical protein
MGKPMGAPISQPPGREEALERSRASRERKIAREQEEAERRVRAMEERLWMQTLTPKGRANARRARKNGV